MTPKSAIFREIAVIPWTPFAGDSFSRNLLTADAFDPARRRQFSTKSGPRNLLWANLAYLWNAGGNTCCAMASHGRRIIDTSIVSQSKVLLIRCPCKSVPQTANQGKTNAFLIKSSLKTCWHPPFCEDGQVRSKSSTSACLVDIPLVAMHTKMRIISWRKTVQIRSPNREIIAAWAPAILWTLIFEIFESSSEFLEMFTDSWIYRSFYEIWSLDKTTWRAGHRSAQNA